MGWLVDSLPVWWPSLKAGLICGCSSLNCCILRPVEDGVVGTCLWLFNLRSCVSVTCYSDHVSSDRTLLTISHISRWRVWAPILYLCGFWGEGLQNPSGEYSQGRNQLLPSPLRAEQEEPRLFPGKRGLGWKLGSASGKWEGGYVCFTEVTYVLELFDCLGHISTLDTTLMGFLAPKTCLHP